MDKEAVKVAEQPMTRQKVYYLDTLEYARCFDSNNKWNLLLGDITYVEDIPTIVKAAQFMEKPELRIAQDGQGTPFHLREG